MSDSGRIPQEYDIDLDDGLPTFAASKPKPCTPPRPIITDARLQDAYLDTICQLRKMELAVDAGDLDALVGARRALASGVRALQANPAYRQYLRNTVQPQCQAYMAKWRETHPTT